MPMAGVLSGLIRFRALRSKSDKIDYLFLSLVDGKVYQTEGALLESVRGLSNIHMRADPYRDKMLISVNQGTYSEFEAKLTAHRVNL